MKLCYLSAIAIAVVIGAGSVAPPAHASIFGDILSAPVKVITKGTGVGAAGAAAAIRKQQQEQAARRDRVRGSQFGWLGEKDYVACLKVRSNRECNISYFGVPVVK